LASLKGASGTERLKLAAAQLPFSGMSGLVGEASQQFVDGDANCICSRGQAFIVRLDAPK
jgi:hypothetical protein